MSMHQMVGDPARASMLVRGSSWLFVGLGAVAVTACVDLSSPDATDPQEQTATAVSELGTGGDGVTTNLEIPLMVALWENPNYGGKKGIIVQDTADLNQNLFNDIASAVGVHPGPDYQSWKNNHGGVEPTVTLWEHQNFAGRSVTLTTGGYADLRNIGFNDIASSVRFNDPSPTNRILPPVGVATIGSIPLVVGLYQNVSGSSVSTPVTWLAEPIGDLNAHGFNDKARGVRVLRGPDYAGQEAVLCRDANGLGGCVFLSLGTTNLNNLQFSAVATSVLFQ